MRGERAAAAQGALRGTPLTRGRLASVVSSVGYLQPDNAAKMSAKLIRRPRKNAEGTLHARARSHWVAGSCLARARAMTAPARRRFTDWRGTVAAYFMPLPLRQPHRAQARRRSPLLLSQP